MEGSRDVFIVHLCWCAPGQYVVADITELFYLDRVSIRRSMKDEKIYHIYARDNVIISSVKEEDFDMMWNTVKGIVGLMKTDYKEDELSYEEVTVQKSQEASY